MKHTCVTVSCVCFLQFALACHYRIATNDRKTNLGLPEVMLGLLPGELVTFVRF